MSDNRDSEQNQNKDKFRQDQKQNPRPNQNDRPNQGGYDKGRQNQDTEKGHNEKDR